MCGREPAVKSAPAFIGPGHCENMVLGIAQSLGLDLGQLHGYILLSITLRGSKVERSPLAPFRRANRRRFLAKSDSSKAERKGPSWQKVKRYSRCPSR
jgi:hypothetical protein